MFSSCPSICPSQVCMNTSYILKGNFLKLFMLVHYHNGEPHLFIVFWSDNLKYIWRSCIALCDFNISSKSLYPQLCLFKWEFIKTLHVWLLPNKDVHTSIVTAVWLYHFWRRYTPFELRILHMKWDCECNSSYSKTYFKWPSKGTLK